jgi:hypothetical protein
MRLSSTPPCAESRMSVMKRAKAPPLQSFGAARRCPHTALKPPRLTDERAAQIADQKERPRASAARVIDGEAG